MHETPTVPKETELFLALKHDAIDRGPSMNDPAFYIDQKGAKALAVVCRKEGQTRLGQCGVVDGDTALLS